MSLIYENLNRSYDIVYEALSDSEHILHLENVKKYINMIGNEITIDEMHKEMNEQIRQRDYWYYQDAKVYVPMNVHNIIGLEGYNVHYKITYGQLRTVHTKDKTHHYGLLEHRTKYCNYNENENKWIYSEPIYHTNVFSPNIITNNRINNIIRGVFLGCTGSVILEILFISYIKTNIVDKIMV